MQITTIFNLFITYGDQFANPSHYDELYYELIRNKEALETFCNVLNLSCHPHIHFLSLYPTSFLCLTLILSPQTITAAKVEGEIGRQLTQHIENFQNIIVHFSTKLDYFASSRGNTALTPKEVVQVIRSNYGSLKLNLLEYLTVHFPHTENPTEVSFLRSYMKSLVVLSRSSLALLPYQLRTGKL